MYDTKHFGTKENWEAVKARSLLWNVDSKITDPFVRAEIMEANRIKEQHRLAGTLEQYQQQLREHYPQSEESSDEDSAMMDDFLLDTDDDEEVNDDFLLDTDDE